MGKSISDRSLRLFLTKIPLFADLEERELAQIAQAGRYRQIPKGSILFFQRKRAGTGKYQKDRSCFFRTIQPMVSMFCALDQ